MKVDKLNILKIINKVKKSDLNRLELNYLYSKSYTMSVSFLRAKFKNNLNFLNSKSNSMEDIAIDAIVPLFVKNNSGIFGLRRSLETWKDEIVTKSDAEYLLSRIIWRRV